VPTAIEDIYAAAQAIMGDVNTAATWTTLTQAPTNYGSDFRIPSGEGRYQIQISPQKNYGGDPNVTYPRVICTVLIHHYVASLADEVEFLHKTMSEAIDRLTVGTVWGAESGIFAFQPDTEPDVDEGDREGNVITFEISAVVLADPTP